jgi:2-keto-4-pentenoate hydratase/2-oxohepta-3-ene-1,7-dioic acid hydratase in catechol pathway
MRLARVLHTSALQPIIALERDGSLYDVAELERLFGTKHAPVDIAERSDFHARAIALSCTGLAELDDRLLAGDRPTEARLYPGSFVWLAPCETDRAMYVQLSDHGPSSEPGGAPSDPRYWIGNARGLLGHDASIAFPAREEEPDFELCIAAVLAEDLHRAGYAEAERAILGYTILSGWTARTEERRGQSSGGWVTRARDFGPQLGPVLVTKDEVGDIRPLRAQARVGNEVLRCSSVGAGTFTLAEAIAFVSDHIELRAGDVIGAPCVAGGSYASHGQRLAYDRVVELTIERIGKLSGRPVRGPEPLQWRSSEAAPLGEPPPAY